MGSPLLLIDEDTSATNLMIRDERMRELVIATQEPITPLIDRIRGLADLEDGGATSLILVMGGSGAYLDVADRVLQMDAYRCEDVTERAREVCDRLPRATSAIPGFPPLTTRAPERLRTGGDRPKTRAGGLDNIGIDKQNIDVADVEQIVDNGQTEAIAWCVRGLLADMADSTKSIRELLDELDARIDEGGLDALTRFGARRYPPFLVRPRMEDVGAALNRYRLLNIVQS